MQTTAGSSFVFALALGAPALLAQEPVAEKAAPVFEDGQAQVVEAFRNPRDWVRHWLWVETDFDTDGDGKKVRIAVKSGTVIE